MRMCMDVYIYSIDPYKNCRHGPSCDGLGDVTGLFGSFSIKMAGELDFPGTMETCKQLATNVLADNNTSTAKLRD